ncbi:MAG: NADH-quinone oxidoreductase subunit NuoK [Candidatus Wallbacteria bacterium]|nr:NADH-quinone oxidoreductase subunit NuoK [Candidatus Wallbacteria bacterium]MBI4865556.1 NADH-quinone oxidoreductase subunit NuoK [Candidatus Wallbacteria bacterium]
MQVIGLTPYLVVASTLFCLGVFCVLTRRNSIGILIGVELMLNAANVNIVAFSRYVGDPVGGQIFAILVILLAASEAVIFLGLLMAVYQRFDTIEVDKVSLLKDEVPGDDAHERA